MNSARQYKDYRKPSWAPPAWVFGPAWGVLYVLIAISFGYALFLYYRYALPLSVFAPFILNLFFNAMYTPLQFRAHDFRLALADAVLIVATLIWAMAAIYPYAHWVAYANVPYLLWTCFAVVLQATIVSMNPRR